MVWMKFVRVFTAFLLAFWAFTVWAQTPEFYGVVPSPDADNNATCAADEIAGMDIGSKIAQGCVQLSDMPIIIIGLIDLLTKLAGTVAVGFILYAGFQLILSGVTEDRESAKNTLKYAIMGLVLTFLAWFIVNLIQVQLTS